MDNKDIMVMLNFSRGDYKLLCEKQSRYAEFQGQMVSYSTWCKVMDHLKKLNSKQQKRNSRMVNVSTQTETVSVD